MGAQPRIVDVNLEKAHKSQIIEDYRTGTGEDPVPCPPNHQVTSPNKEPVQVFAGVLRSDL